MLERLIEVKVMLENGNDVESVIAFIDKVITAEKERLENKFAGTRGGELVAILEENKSGIPMADIITKMGIKKGNFGSIVMGLRKSGIGIVKVGDKYVLEKYIKIG